MNLLSSAAMDEFETTFAPLDRDPSIKAIAIVSGKPNTFVTGADLHEIIKMTEASEALAMSVKGQRIFDAISNMKKPTVVGINGVCLGGGLELALCCDRRIATDAEITELGLPEVRLGFIPGLGGTQRLPRLVGAKAAVELILSAHAIKPQRALAIGLVDQVLKPDDLLGAVEALTFKVGARGKTGPETKRRKS